MNRYLGTKTKILSHLEDAIKSIGGVTSVCDIFAGSLAVSLYLKRRGYGVIANDINALSYAYARAYLTTTEIAPLDTERLLPRLSGDARLAVSRGAAILLRQEAQVFQRENIYGEFSSWTEYSERLAPLAFVTSFLAIASKPSHGGLRLRSDVLDHYTKSGRYSQYHSVRGRRGKRNFFSANNARRIDFVLSHLRHWTQSGLLAEATKYTLLSILLDAMERCVNCQGTYHDFPRLKLESRARKSMSLRLPNYFGLLHSHKKHLAGLGDSLTFIGHVPRHDVLYIDPPYNFRQYTAYYHLPNFFVQYPDIEELDSYLADLEFVRGQNMKDDFPSPFSNRDQFLPALDSLVRGANCRHVILSYFDGVNHWNQFLEADNSRGFQLIRSFFKSSLFVRGSIRIVPIDRVNYQSQNGHRAKKVTEYLFIGERSKNLQRGAGAN